MRDSMRSLVCRRPVWVVAFWFTLAILVGVLAPDLSQLAAEGQAEAAWVRTLRACGRPKSCGGRGPNSRLPHWRSWPCTGQED